MRNVVQVAILGGAIVVAGFTAAAEPREHGAHVHGTAHLDIAFVGQTLAIDLHSPAMNIVGFGHAPGNDQQRRILQDALDILRTTERMFSLPEAAGCVASDVDATRVVGDEHDEHDGHEHADGDGERHSEIQASWRFECESPAELNGIQVHLFERFPATEYLRVQVLTDTAQRALLLTPDNARVPF